MRIAVVALAMICLSSPAVAITGAQLREEESELGPGYVFGAVEMYLSSLPWDEPRRQCIASAQFSEDSLFQAVTAYIDNHPYMLTKSAVTSVLAFLLEACPADE
jgi:hypothetical protein